MTFSPFFYDCYVHDYLINEFMNQCSAKIDLTLPRGDMRTHDVSTPTHMRQTLSKRACCQGPFHSRCQAESESEPACRVSGISELNNWVLFRAC